MAFLDEDELDPADEPSPRRSGADRQRQLLARRLVALGIVVLLVILAVLGVRGCLEARKERGFENYLRDLDAMAATSRQLSNEFFERLNNPPEELTGLDLQNEIRSDRGTAEGLLNRAEGLDTPDELSGAQDDVVFSFELRRDALGTIAEQIPNALGDDGRNNAIAAIARQMQVLLASDVVYARARREIQQVLSDEELEGTAPASRFLQDPIDRYLDELEVAAILAPIAVDPDETAGVRGLELLGTTLDPPGTTLIPGSLNTVDLERQSELQVEVQNAGDNREQEVSVQYSISGAPEAIEGETTIDRISQAGSETASLPLQPAPPTDTELTLTVTIAPVPGETLIENNESTYQLTFTSG